MSETLLVVSARTRTTAPAAEEPRRDYEVLASALGARVLDRDDAERGLLARLVARCAGTAAAQAWLAFRSRHGCSAIVTDGEHIGIPLALLLKLARSDVAHVTIGHYLSNLKKRPFFRLLRAGSHLSRIALHSRRQRELAIAELGLAPEQLALVPYQVDTLFWRPLALPEERLVASAGLEYRDYATLFAAVDGLDARVVIGASSHWSRHRDAARRAAPPANVTVDAFGYRELRELYARAAVVVVPLQDVDYQAGVTTLLEAMAMGKAVVVTHTRGQYDVVEDRRRTTRGTPPRPRPVGLLRILARETGLPAEANGIYVPPHDPLALRRAIGHLLDDAEHRARLGAAARRTAERFFTLELFAERMRALVEDARADVAGRSGSEVAVVPRSARG